MTEVDKTYFDLVTDVLSNGIEKDTRSGKVISVFGRQMRFDLKKGFPMVTTRKLYFKGIVHELLWFLQHGNDSYGGMNIDYLVKNDVHIWDADAYRWFTDVIAKKYSEPGSVNEYVVYRYTNKKGEKRYQYWMEGAAAKQDPDFLRSIDKDTFIEMVLEGVEIWGADGSRYRFGDLGPIYGTQWRSYGGFGTDQIADIIKTLKKNPEDRRMLCIAYNPSRVSEMALPPCHVMFQFYTRKLSTEERIQASCGRGNGLDTKQLDKLKIPKYGLSLMYTMRSNDLILGCPFNMAEYGLMVHIIAKLVNMVPDELVASIGDCHIYKDHVDNVVDNLLHRSGAGHCPKLVVEGAQKKVDDFKFEDFFLDGYNPDPPLKFNLFVG